MAVASIGDVVDKLAVRPLADLLVGVRTFVHAICDVAHIPNCQMGNTMLDGEVDQLAAGLMQMVPLLPIELGRGAGFLALQPLPASAPLSAAVDPRLIGGVALVPQLLVMAQQPPTYHERLPAFGTDRSRIDLAKIDSRCLPALVQRRMGWLLDGERKLIVIGPQSNSALRMVAVWKRSGRGNTRFRSCRPFERMICPSRTRMA